MFTAILGVTVVATPISAQSVRFVDISSEAGVDFIHNNGAYGKKYLPETMGSGVALFDFDSDGDQDLLFANGVSWHDDKTVTADSESTSRLYRNRGDGHFEDVTGGSGLDVPLYAIGIAVGDYDGDRDPDVYLTALGRNHLFQNEGDGKFTERAEAAGVDHRGFGSSATWLDYDKDGDLDLFLLNYVQWSLENDLFCALDGKKKSYCTPESYKGDSAVLYRNEGNGGFTDVTERAGVLAKQGKGLGVAVIDFNRDSWPDIAVANDTQPNFLYENKRDGSFVEVGVESGIAFGENGAARGAMGIDASDYDGSGHPSLFIGNFSNEMVSLYHNEGMGFFIDNAPISEIGRNSLLTLAFAAFFFDYDLDGRLDIFVTNGHVETDIQTVQSRVSYAQPPHLFRNIGESRFEEVTSRVGSDLSMPMVGRGAAYGDIDGDGDADLVVSTSGGSARVFRNDGGNKNAWIGFRLKGNQSNPDAIGARVQVTIGERSEARVVKSATGYCSQNQQDVIIGMGTQTELPVVEITWPSGTKQTLRNPKIRKIHTVEEPTP